MGKRFLFLMRHTPYEGAWTQEALDMLLTTAAFDQQVRVLFLDDGVFQLLSGQQAAKWGRKPIDSQLGALGLYDVEEIFVERESLQERGLSRYPLILSARIVARADVAALLSEQDVLVSG